MVNNSISFHCDLWEAERVDFEDIKIHDEDNKASTKSETVCDMHNVSTCPVCEYG